MILDFFKYNSIISVPLFTLIYLYIKNKIPKFSFAKTTLSKSIFYLKNPILTSLYKINFVLKALLDVTFVLYGLNFFNVSYIFPIYWIMTLSPILFGSLAYFTEDKFNIIHWIITYISGLLWFIGAIFFSQMTFDVFFIQLTIIMSITIFSLVLISYLARKTNILI